jgi:hypothetical protein
MKRINFLKSIAMGMLAAIMLKKSEPKPTFPKGSIISITNEETGAPIEFLGGATITNEPIWATVEPLELSTNIHVERPHGIPNVSLEGTFSMVAANTKL